MIVLKIFRTIIVYDFLFAGRQRDFFVYLPFPGCKKEPTYTVFTLSIRVIHLPPSFIETNE